MEVGRRVAGTVLELLEYFPAVGIVGPRQVGKTSLVKMLRENFQRESLYLDLELPSDLNKLRDAELYLNENEDKTIIIDEVQRMPALFPLLRAVIDQRRIPGRFLLLGSASPDLLKNSSETLAGRIAYVELHPFSLEEVGKENHLLHWLRGGFPRAWLARNTRELNYWLQDFVKAYAERDLPLLGLPTTPVSIRRLMNMVAGINGGQLNQSLLSKSLGVSVPNVSNQLDYLDYAFLIRRLPAWSANTKKRLVKSPKVYVRDSGILHYLLGISNLEALYANAMAGNSWEGYVIQQVISELPEDYNFYYYRTQDGSEADLVIVKNDHPVATLEIKLSNSPELTKGNLIAITDLETEVNLVVTPSADDYRLKENIHVCSVRTMIDQLKILGIQ